MSGKQKISRDTRTPEQKREQELRNSAAVRGISYEEMKNIANGIEIRKD